MIDETGKVRTKRKKNYIEIILSIHAKGNINVIEIYHTDNSRLRGYEPSLP